MSKKFSQIFHHHVKKFFGELAETRPVLTELEDDNEIEVDRSLCYILASKSNIFEFKSFS